MIERRHDLTGVDAVSLVHAQRGDPGRSLGADGHLVAVDNAGQDPLGLDRPPQIGDGHAADDCGQEDRPDETNPSHLSSPVARPTGRRSSKIIDF